MDRGTRGGTATGAAMIVLVALMGAACSSGSGSSSGGSAASLPVSASPRTAQEISAQECPAEITATDFTPDASFTITTKGFAFHPVCFIARSGSTITIKNEDPKTHNFTVIATDVALTIPKGQTTSDALALAPATYYFYCTIHPDMTGTMVVVS